MSNKESQDVIKYSGIGIGCALAMILSWSISKSILWCILHGIFGWFYVIYFAIVY